MRIISKFAPKINDNEVNTMPSRVEVSKCPSIAEMLKMFEQGYPIDRTIKYDEGRVYNDEDIDQMDSVIVDPDLTDIDAVAKGLESKYSQQPVEQKPQQPEKQPVEQKPEQPEE